MYGVASAMFHVDALEGKSAKPSWCLAVMTTYFMPASLAAAIQATGSYFTGLKRLAKAWYSATGILALCMIHSP